MKPSYVGANDMERERLHSLTARLSDDDLRHQLANGLSVAAVLIHLAFWDRYCEALLGQWEKSGFAATRTNFDAVNAAVLTIGEAVPDRTAVTMAQTAADAADEQAATMPLELVATIEREGYHRMLERAAHRRQHLDQIARALRAEGVR